MRDRQAGRADRTRVVAAEEPDDLPASERRGVSGRLFTISERMLDRLDDGLGYIGCSAGVACLTETTYDTATDLLSQDVGVIWAIGWSMIALAALVWLPRLVVLAIGILIIVGHNALDPISAETAGAIGTIGVSFRWISYRISRVFTS